METVPAFMFFLLQAESVPWGQIATFGPTVVLLALILWFLIRMAPVWKEVKFKELEVRGDESKVKGEQATALNSLASVLRDVSVEQRRATENIEISQRVNAELADRLSTSLQLLARRLDGLEALEPRVKGLEEKFSSLRLPLLEQQV